MSKAIAIRVERIHKTFRLYPSAKARFSEVLHPFRKKFHQTHQALCDVSFDVGHGEIFGIFGRNGSGKSTLLQIVCGIMQATSGQVKVNGRISALLELGAGFNPEFTGRENVLLNGSIMGFSKAEMRVRLPEIEAFADIGAYFDQPVKTYSSGMYVRVAFAAAVHVDPEILVVDEALSVGDAKFQHRCFAKIHGFKDQGRTVLVVSHDIDTLSRICNRGAVLDKGRLDFVGSITDAVNRYQDLLFGSAPKAELSGVIGSLNADTEDRIVKKTNYNRYETRLGNRAAEVIDFDLVVNQAINPQEIPPESEVELIVKIALHEPLDEVSVGFGFVTVDGIDISGADLEKLGMPLLAGNAGDLIAVRFHFHARLAGGLYFLNLGCERRMGGDHHYLDMRRSLASIQFGGAALKGFVNLGVRAEILPLNAEVGAS